MLCLAQNLTVLRSWMVGAALRPGGRGDSVGQERQRKPFFPLLVVAVPGIRLEGLWLYHHGWDSCLRSVVCSLPLWVLRMHCVVSECVCVCMCVPVWVGVCVCQCKSHPKDVRGNFEGHKVQTLVAFTRTQKPTESAVTSPPVTQGVLRSPRGTAVYSRP